MANVKISDLATTETSLANVAFIEGERADTSPVKVPPALLGMARISQQVLGSAAASIDFTSIPAGFETLIVVIQGQTSAASTQSLLMRFNGDTAGNYDWNRWNRFLPVAANTSAGVGSTSMDVASFNASSVTSRAAIATIEVPGYSRTTFFKMLQSLSSVSTGATTGDQFNQVASGVWRSTAAINQITLLLASGNFVTGTVATLYGRM